MAILTTYYLEMHTPGSLNGKHNPGGLSIVEAEVKEYQLNRFLYKLVGGPWNWRDKLHQSDREWQQYAEHDNLRTWVAYYKGAIAGYFELKKEGKNTQISHFGLAPKFFGKGFGAYLLSETIKSAWAWHGTERVWVHTCTDDHPNALKNYLARGFTLYDEISTPFVEKKPVNN